MTTEETAAAMELAFNAGFDRAILALVGEDRMADWQINVTHPNYLRDRRRAFMDWLLTEQAKQSVRVSA